MHLIASVADESPMPPIDVRVSRASVSVADRETRLAHLADAIHRDHYLVDSDEVATAMLRFLGRDYESEPGLR